MGLMKGTQTPEEQLHDIAPKKQGGFKLGVLRMYRSLIKFTFGATILGIGMTGLMAILGNKISGNPFIGLTLFFIVAAFGLYKALQYLDRKIAEYY